MIFGDLRSSFVSGVLGNSVNACVGVMGSVTFVAWVVVMGNGVTYRVEQVMLFEWSFRFSISFWGLVRST